MKTAREVAHEVVAKARQCVFGLDWGVFGDAVSEHSDACDALAAAIEAVPRQPSIATIRRETLELAADVVEVDVSEGCSADHCQSNPVARLRALAAAPSQVAEYCAERDPNPMGNPPREPGRDQTLEEARRLFASARCPAVLDIGPTAEWEQWYADRDAWLAGMKSRPQESVPPPPREPGKCAPGQRCTNVWAACHDRHAYEESWAETWTGIASSPEQVGRCPYVAPAEPGKCATWCGGPSSSLPRPWPEYWTRADDEERDLRHFCSPACRGAGRPSNPADSDANQSPSGTTKERP